MSKFWDRVMGRTQAPQGAKALEIQGDLAQSLRIYGLPAWDSYGAMYRKQPAVRAVVDFLADNVAQLNPKVYERVGNSDRKELPEHPLARQLHNPNPDTTRFRHLRDTVADLAIYDRAYWRKMRRGRMTALVRIAPSRVTRVKDPDTKQTVWRLQGDPQETLQRDDLVIFTGYHPDENEEGVSPLETLRQVLAQEAASTLHRENYWRNAARQSGWIERPIEAEEWSDSARERFRADMESMMSGSSNAGRIGVLEEGMKWNASAFSPRESEYIDGRRLTYEEVCIAYFGPMIGGRIANVLKGDAESTHRQVYQDVLGPWLRFLQDEIELQLLYRDFEPLRRDREIYVEFNLAEKLKGSFEEQGKTLVTATGVPYMSVNESRARLNLPRIDDPAFDQPIQPMNVLYGGQPAVTVPTEDPGTPRTAARKAAPPAALRRRDEVAKQHEAILRRLFDRQEESIKSALGAVKKSGSKATVDDAWDKDRWDRELTQDLYALATVTARDTGKRAARQMRGTYDEPRTLDYLQEGASATAKNVNDHTLKDLRKAQADGVALSEVFDTARNSRAPQIGLSRATMLINFARTEAAKHSMEGDGRQRSKTWVVTSARSRHPQLNGETVGAGETFSNGAKWPGDPALPVDEVAGCSCLLDLS